MVSPVSRQACSLPDLRKAIWSERICIRRDEQVDLIRVLRSQPVLFKLLGSSASAKDGDREERLVAKLLHVLERQCRYALRSRPDGEWGFNENKTAEGM